MEELEETDVTRVRFSTIVQAATDPTAEYVLLVPTVTPNPTMYVVRTVGAIKIPALAGLWGASNIQPRSIYAEFAMQPNLFANAALGASQPWPWMSLLELRVKCDRETASVTSVPANAYQTYFGCVSDMASLTTVTAANLKQGSSFSVSVSTNSDRALMCQFPFKQPMPSYQRTDRLLAQPFLNTSTKSTVGQVTGPGGPYTGNTGTANLQAGSIGVNATFLAGLLPPGQVPRVDFNNIVNPISIAHFFFMILARPHRRLLRSLDNGYQEHGIYSWRCWRCPIRPPFRIGTKAWLWVHGRICHLVMRRFCCLRNC